MKDWKSETERSIYWPKYCIFSNKRSRWCIYLRGIKLVNLLSPLTANLLTSNFALSQTKSLGFNWYFLCYLLLFVWNLLVSNPRFSRNIFHSPWQKYTLYISNKYQNLLVEIKMGATKLGNILLFTEQLIIFAWHSSFVRYLHLFKPHQNVTQLFHLSSA